MAPSKSRRPKLLSSTRPRVPTTSPFPSSLSSSLSSSIKASSIAKPSPLFNKAKTTRTIIRTHHTLHKRLAAAKAGGDAAAVSALTAEIERRGGLEAYQRASLTGQSRDRGGDSSRVLVGWLLRSRPRPGPIPRPEPKPEPIPRPEPRPEPIPRPESELESVLLGQPVDRSGTIPADDDDDARDNDSSRLTTIQTTMQEYQSRHTTTGTHLRLLEVGALDPANAFTRLRFVNPVRIDLRSQHHSIETQDFMVRPVPRSPGERFDIVSLSLVLNYVPDPVMRGAMLRRCALFLDTAPPPVVSGSVTSTSESTSVSTSVSSSPDRPLALLFLVLPRPCIDNSRYVTWAHLSAMMGSIGFVAVCHKLTNKLSYSLWQLERSLSRQGPGPRPRPDGAFRKREINPGKGRNNFCIVLE